jgi:hypothetical protein
MIATWLMERFHASIWIAVYGAVLCAVTITSVLLPAETRRRTLARQEPRP